MSIKVSLDGMETTHNRIRGNNFAYSNAIKTLEMLTQFQNVDVYVLTTVMQENLNELNILDKMIKTKFPQYVHQHDLIFPTANQQQRNSAFTESDFLMIYDKYLNIFNIEKTSREMRSYRCSGGITSAAIDFLKHLRICTGARDKQFILGDLNRDK